MPTSKANQKREGLKHLIKVSRFNGWPDEQLMDEIEKLYAPAARRKSPAKKA